MKGYVSRDDFKNAMVFAKMGKSMTLEFIYKLADTYAVGSGGEYVDYLTCFRSYLNELISIMPSQVVVWQFLLYLQMHFSRNTSLT